MYRNNNIPSIYSLVRHGSGTIIQVIVLNVWRESVRIGRHSLIAVVVSQRATPQQLTRRCQNNDADPSRYFHCIKTTYYCGEHASYLST